MEHVYIVEYWYYDSKDTVSVISVHNTVYGAETRARALAEEQYNDGLEYNPTHRLSWHRNDDGNGIASIEVKDGPTLESWTVVRTKLEE